MDECKRCGHLKKQHYITKGASSDACFLCVCDSFEPKIEITRNGEDITDEVVLSEETIIPTPAESEPTSETKSSKYPFRPSR